MAQLVQLKNIFQLLLGLAFAFKMVAAASAASPADCALSTPELGAVTGAKAAMNEWKAKPAAVRNVDYIKNARWIWGNTTVPNQTGFEIYIPLIQKTIGTTALPSSAEFVDALKKWQIQHHSKDKNKVPNARGVLDVDSFLFLKSYWQAHREVHVTPDDLPTQKIPVSERYDPARPDGQSMIGEKTYNAYQAMLTAARKDGITGDDLKMVSAYRDKKKLKEILDNVPEVNKGYTAADKDSVHGTGRALDLYLSGGNPSLPTSSKYPNRLGQSKSKAYLWLVQNAEKFGFRNYFYEPWHWEYVGTPENPLTKAEPKNSKVKK